MLRSPVRRVDAARSWARARQTFASLTAQIAELRRERDELRAAIADMLAARRAVQHAQHELGALYRERELRRARMAVRDPALPLQ